MFLVLSSQIARFSSAALPNSRVYLLQAPPAAWALPFPSTRRGGSWSRSSPMARLCGLCLVRSSPSLTLATCFRHSSPTELMHCCAPSTS